MPHWTLGRVHVTRIIESETPTETEFLLSAATPDALAPYANWLRPHFVDGAGRMILCIQSFVVESQGLCILVDTCVGNDKTSPRPDWHQQQWSYLADLDAAGFPRDSIDVVVCTHLHPDHVGWNTMYNDGRWVPTFPRARYLMVEHEVTRWQRARDDMIYPMMQESVAPVLDAGLVDFIETDHTITDEVRLTPTPGHTPDHVSVVLASGETDAVITGDLMHHPVQCAHPEWGSPADARQLAVETRRTFCAQQAERETLVLGSHFGGPCAGHIESQDDQWRFRVQDA